MEIPRFWEKEVGEAERPAGHRFRVTSWGWSQEADRWRAGALRNLLSQILRYKPEASISFHNGKLVYHEHEIRDYTLTPSEVFTLIIEIHFIFVVSFLLLPWHLVKAAALLIRRLAAEP